MSGTGRQYAQALQQITPEAYQALTQTQLPTPAKGMWQWGVKRAKNGKEYHLFGSHPDSDTYELYGRHPTLASALNAQEQSRALFSPVVAGRRPGDQPPTE